MPLYDIEVTEVQRHRVLYTIEAQDKIEALEKAEDGDTINEKTLKLIDVIDRSADHASCRVGMFPRPPREGELGARIVIAHIYLRYRQARERLARIRKGEAEEMAEVSLDQRCRIAQQEEARVIELWNTYQSSITCLRDGNLGYMGKLYKMGRARNI